jgi:hypothetical protein
MPCYLQLVSNRYATNAKNIVNKPKVNEDPKDAALRTLKEEKERYLNGL